MVTPPDSPSPSSDDRKPVRRSVTPNLIPLPANPYERERHIELIVRPNDSPGEYLSRRALGWILALEELAAEAEDDYKFKRLIINDLLRMYSLSLPGASKAGKPSQELHLHKHEHGGAEVPDLSKLPVEQLRDLAQGFAARVQAAKSDPTQGMTQDEKGMYEALLAGRLEVEALDVEAEDADNREGEDVSDGSSYG